MSESIESIQKTEKLRKEAQKYNEDVFIDIEQITKNIVKKNNDSEDHCFVLVSKSSVFNGQATMVIRIIKNDMSIEHMIILKIDSIVGVEGFKNKAVILTPSRKYMSMNDIVEGRVFNMVNDFDEFSKYIRTYNPNTEDRFDKLG